MAKRERRVISLVGGGGKTTTMYALAEIFREEGKKVIVTTSTHSVSYTHLDVYKRQSKRSA